METPGTSGYHPCMTVLCSCSAFLTAFPNLCSLRWRRQIFTRSLSFFFCVSHAPILKLLPSLSASEPYGSCPPFRVWAVCFAWSIFSQSGIKTSFPLVFESRHRRLVHYALHRNFLLPRSLSAFPRFTKIWKQTRYLSLCQNLHSPLIPPPVASFRLASKYQCICKDERTGNRRVALPQADPLSLWWYLIQALAKGLIFKNSIHANLNNQQI